MTSLRRAVHGALVGLALLLLPVAAAGADDTATLRLTPAEGPPASSVKVTGTGHVACRTKGYETASVAVFWDGRGPVATAKVADGDFSAAFAVPEDAAPGPHSVSSSCWFGGDAAGSIAKTTFFVRSTLALSPAAGPRDATVRVQGDGFPPVCRETLELHFDRERLMAELEFLPPRTHGPTVGFSGSFAVPDRPAGPHEVSVHCPAGEGDPALASASFEVVPGSTTTSSTTTSSTSSTTTSTTETTTTTGTATSDTTTTATSDTTTSPTTTTTTTTTTGPTRSTTGTTSTSGPTTDRSTASTGLGPTTTARSASTGAGISATTSTRGTTTTSAPPGGSPPATRGGPSGTPPAGGGAPPGGAPRGSAHGPAELTRSLFPASLRTPDEVPTSLVRVLHSAVLAMTLVLLVGFPAEIFNKTLEENYDEIRGWFGRLRCRRRQRRLTEGTQLALFAVLGALMLCLIDPSAALDRKTAALALGFLVAVPLTMLFFELPTEIYYTRKSGLLSTLRVLPVALAVAGVCALVSRLAHFQPGYVYGLFAGYAALRDRRLAIAQEGRGILIGSLCALAVSLLAWADWGMSVSKAAAGPHPSFGLLVLDATLSSVFVLGVEGVVFALIPLRFLHGHRLARWSRATWALVFGMGAFAFAHVLLETKSEGAGVVPLASMLALFVGFGAFSLAFWAYFRYRPQSARRKRWVGD